MTLVANSFLKAIPVKLTGGEVIANTLTKTYTNRIEKLEAVEVFYNGQLIENSTANPTGKFYYTAVPTLVPSASDMTTTWIPGSTVPEDTSDIVFTVFPNPAYRGNGYLSGTSADTFSIEDSIVISYYYVVYTVA